MNVPHASMLQDFEVSRRTEIDVAPLNRAFVRLVNGSEAKRGLV